MSVTNNQHEIKTKTNKCTWNINSSTRMLPHHTSWINLNDVLCMFNWQMISVSVLRIWFANMTWACLVKIFSCVRRQLSYRYFILELFCVHCFKSFSSIVVCCSRLGYRQNALMIPPVQLSFCEWSRSWAPCKSPSPRLFGCSHVGLAARRSVLPSKVEVDGLIGHSITFVSC